MSDYDLAILWEWDYDISFNEVMKKLAFDSGVSTLLINPDNLPEVESLMSKNKINIKCFLDRASESDERFFPLVHSFMTNKVKPINPPSSVHKAINKALMHRLLSKYDIPLAETIIIPPESKKKDLPFISFEYTGIPFVLKPSNGGGGVGVYTDLTELNQVAKYRKEFPEQEYLIQQKIIPGLIEQRPLWFRIFHVCESIFLCYWNPYLKTFSKFDKDHMVITVSKKIKTIVRNIAYISKLKFFSTEIAVQKNGDPIVIDYVNDPVDLRPKSLHRDGIPDELIYSIAAGIISHVKKT